MSGHLLDTNIALFALTGDARLSASVRRALVRGPNWLSVASYWEVAIKSMRGSLVVGDVRLWWQEALEQLAAVPLPIRPEHVAGVLALPSLHKDPFDRILIAQAGSEKLTLLTADRVVEGYASADLKIVR